MDGSLLDQGKMLMLAGMGTVFAFLTVLVVATTLMSWLIVRLQRTDASADVSDEEVAAITAAIATHRQKQQK